MEKQVLVNESSLVNIADALREQLGPTHTEYVEGEDYAFAKKISKTSNALSFTERDGDYPGSASVYDTVTIEGASRLEVAIAYQTESIQYDYVQVCSGDKSKFNSSATKYGGSTLTEKTLTFDNTDTVTFYFKSDGSSSSYLGYYAEVIGFDSNGEQIKDYDNIIITQVPIEVPNIFQPNQMGDAVSSITKPNWDKPINTANDLSGESKPIEGDADSTNRVITFDLSSKIKPNDYNWYFITYCGSDSTSTKYALQILPITTQWPTAPTNKEVQIASSGVIWSQYAKSGYINTSSSIVGLYPYALYIKAYYNPSTCKLKVDYRGQINTSNFSSRVDKVGQLIYRPTIEE